MSMKAAITRSETLPKSESSRAFGLRGATEKNEKKAVNGAGSMWLCDMGSPSLRVDPAERTGAQQGMWSMLRAGVLLVTKIAGLPLTIRQ
jgi:hypothetical protein